MSRELKFETSLGTMAAQVWNSEDSECILALHGWLDNSNSYVPLAQEFLNYGKRLIACDLPGHGLSATRPDGCVFNFVDSTFDLVAIIDALGWKSAHLIGHSMGAGVACLLAAAAPDLVKSLVLIEGIGPLSAPPEEVSERLQVHLRQRKRLGQKKFPVYKSFDEALVARMNAAEISEPAARLIVERGLRQVNGGLTWRTDARLRLRSAHPYTEEQVCSYLDNVRCPTLFIRAKDGYPFGEEIISGRLRRFKNLTTCELEGNHHLHMDHPLEVFRAIRGFYERVLT